MTYILPTQNDAASNLGRFRARYYDPALGRFTQTDPSGQESNPYVYAACNPTNSSDPTGFATCAGAAAALVASTALVAVSFVGLIAIGASGNVLLSGVIASTLFAYGIARTVYYAANAVRAC
ncbi:RHS repeat-associated protein [Microbacterium halimionae]|uniref:RHS repeat-associated protein n=1 Tax=Microbacterium halimionae TaxID=1526413 RepID=A0A7W3PL55_9MICO|nr:RHS repeat-associated core domain-containing protein [Microbacterium halimionae]MBA8815592.1 RHS repeat-associated protein [Microbacterium halimionae]NII95638.1 RHS repeat-associated protein [Microbacterium halimionae]